MINPEKLTREKLSRALVRKHKKFLEEYKREFEILEKIRVLEDKEEQIEHWLNLTKNTKEEDKYIKELEEADKELDLLKKELKKIRKGLGKDNNERNYFLLKSKIKNEENALLYWKEKIKEWRK